MHVNSQHRLFHFYLSFVERKGKNNKNLNILRIKRAFR